MDLKKKTHFHIALISEPIMELQSPFREGLKKNLYVHISFGFENKKHFATRIPVLYTKNHHFQQPFVKPEGEHMTNVLFRSIFPSYIEYSYCSQ